MRIYGAAPGADKPRGMGRFPDRRLPLPALLVQLREDAAALLLPAASMIGRSAFRADHHIPILQRLPADWAVDGIISVHRLGIILPYP
jgi:hypothetical protein